MICGAVYYDEKFQFRDGSTINKIFIVLCEYGTDYLALKITSKDKYKTSEIVGCQMSIHRADFFVPKYTSFFRETTWIELDEVFEIDANILYSKLKDGVAYKVGDLSIEFMKSLIQCTLMSEGLDGIHEEFLSRTLKDL